MTHWIWWAFDLCSENFALVDVFPRESSSPCQVGHSLWFKLLYLIFDLENCALVDVFPRESSSPCQVSHSHWFKLLHLLFDWRTWFRGGNLLPLGRCLVQRDPASKDPRDPWNGHLKMLWYDVMMLRTCMQKQVSVYTGNHIHTKQNKSLGSGLHGVVGKYPLEVSWLILS